MGKNRKDQLSSTRSASKRTVAYDEEPINGLNHAETIIPIQKDEIIFNADQDNISIEDDVFIDDSTSTLPSDVSNLISWKPEIPFENVIHFFTII